MRNAPCVFRPHFSICLFNLQRFVLFNFDKNPLDVITVFTFDVYNLAASNFNTFCFLFKKRKENDLTYAKFSMSFPLSPSVNCFALTKRRLTLHAVMQINPFTAGCLHSSHCSIELTQALIRKG